LKWWSLFYHDTLSPFRYFSGEILAELPYRWKAAQTAPMWRSPYWVFTTSPYWAISVAHFNCQTETVHLPAQKLYPVHELYHSCNPVPQKKKKIALACSLTELERKL
jgi:hypothetical protein